MLLREHPVEAGIDPVARVLSEDEAEFELFQACIDAMEDAAESDDHRALALRELGVYHATLELPHMVQRRDEAEAAFRVLGGSVDAWRENIRAQLGNRLIPLVEDIRDQLTEDVEWLRGAYTGPGEDGLCDRMSNFLADLGDPLRGVAEELFERMREARKHIHLGVGSSKNWLDIQRIKDFWREFRDRVDYLEKLPQWNEHDETALEVMTSLQALFGDACRRYAGPQEGVGGLGLSGLGD